MEISELCFRQYLSLHQSESFHVYSSWVVSLQDINIRQNRLEGKKILIAIKRVPAAAAAAAATKSLQSCPTLCDPIDGSPPGFPIPGILQARVLEWRAIAFSKRGSLHSDKMMKS